ncbi:MAG: diguanylate cyclase [Nitriliruptoraceae bacterium]|nr:diguanylate cyclase [Nitriliruptoraceae bacterium]
MDTEIRRRAYAAGLLFGVVTVPVIWWLRPDDAVMRVAYPVLTLYLAVVLIGLLTRRLAIPTSERLMLGVIGVFYFARLLGLLFGGQTYGEFTGELFESTFLGLMLIYLFAFLAFESRRALVIGLSYFALVAGALAIRVVPSLGDDVSAAQAVSVLRVLTFHLAFIGLVYALAYGKEQLAQARATADAMTVLAHEDTLTGLANRRGVQEVLATHLEEVGASGGKLSLLLFDLDGFKAVNDTHGHLVGDAVLQQVAATLAPELRETDSLGRWGGEEFVVLAPGTDLAAAQRLAERSREVVARRRFMVDGVDVPVTVSVGVATSRVGDDARSLVKRADDALYAAKRAGRNRVEVARADGEVGATP